MERTSTSAVLTSFLIIVILGIDCSNAICSRQLLPPTFNLGAFLPMETQGQIRHPTNIVVPSYRFTCEGNITHWEAYTSDNGAHPIEFQVWRDTGGTRVYDLVGANFFPDVSPTNGLLRLSVAEDEQIQVMPGDFVGLRTFVGMEGNPFRIQTIMGTYIDYNETMIDSTPTQISLTSNINNAFGCFSASRSFPSTQVAIAPLINAAINANDTQTPEPELTPEPSTLDDMTTPTSSPSITQSLVIATAILSGLLFTLLILGAVTATIICCYVRLNNKGAVRTQTQAPASMMTTNAAYNSQGGGAPIEMNRNGAYDAQTGDSDGPYYSRIN